MDEITGHEDYINAHDVQKRIAELKALRSPEDWEADELEALRGLAEDFASYAGNPDTGSAIRDSYMKDYAMELGDDLGVGQDNPLFSYVDWGDFADDLKSDMAEVRFRGTAYYIRS
jgi:hypothetical protein